MPSAGRTQARPEDTEGPAAAQVLPEGVAPGRIGADLVATAVPDGHTLLRGQCVPHSARSRASRPHELR